jgi:hypothetical protein
LPIQVEKRSTVSSSFCIGLPVVKTARTMKRGRLSAAPPVSSTQLGVDYDFLALRPK